MPTTAHVVTPPTVAVPSVSYSATVPSCVNPPVSPFHVPFSVVFLLLCGLLLRRYDVLLRLCELSLLPRL
jgi:hypothetical protein